MWLIERRRQVARHLCIGSVVMAFAALPEPIQAHNLHMTGGEVTIDSTQIKIHLNISAEDWLHWYEIRPDENGQIAGTTLADAALRHVQFLEDVLVLRDAVGTRLEFRCRSSEPHGSPNQSHLARDARNLFTEYVCITDLSEPGLLFALQLQPGVFPVDVLWQVVLSVRSVTQASESVVRLTSRGNVELIDLSPVETVPTGRASCESRGQARFQEICAQLSTHGEILDIMLSIPLPLLSTWLSVPANSDGFLSHDHQESILKQTEELVLKNIQIANGGSMKLRVKNIELVQVSAGGARSEKRPLWTTRIRARLQCNLAGEDGVTLTWGLFNAAVLSAHTIHCTDGQCREQVVSTYAPTISLKHQKANPSKLPTE